MQQQPKPRRTFCHGKKKPRVGHQKQGLPGIGREVFGSGDVKANLQKKTTQNQNKEQKNKEQGTRKSWQLVIGKTKNI